MQSRPSVTPDSKAARERFLGSMKDKFTDYDNLIMLGDWNFVTDDLDYQSQSDHRELDVFC